MESQQHNSERPCVDRTQRDLFAWGLLAGVLLCGVLAGPFFAGRVYTCDDLGAFHLPLRAFYAEQLARGEPFDWTPQLFSGFYVAGEGQAGMYHPLHRLLYGHLPLQAAMAWELLASYPLMLAGTYLFLRRLLGRRDAAMLGSLAFTFSGFNLLHFVHPNAVAIVAHIPWLLWAIEIVAADSNRYKRMAAEAGIALLTGSQLLLGYPQYVWFSLLAEAAFAWFVTTGSRRVQSTDGFWQRLAIAKGIGLMLGGIQLIPTFDTLLHSARVGTDAAFTGLGSLHPLNLVQLVAPYLFADRVLFESTHEFGLYIGAVPLMLIVWLRMRRDHLGPLGPLAVAASVFALVALFLSFGEGAWVYRLQRMLPLVGGFRCPCRYLVLFQLATSVLAAIGFVLLVQQYWNSRRKHPVPGVFITLHVMRVRHAERDEYNFAPLWIGGGLSLVAAAGGLAMQGRSWTAPVPLVLAGPLLIATAAVLVILAARGVRPALVGLMLFAAIDLGVYGLTYAVYPKTYPLDYFVTHLVKPPADSVGRDKWAGRDERAGRVLVDLKRFDQTGSRAGNQLMLAGWCRAFGYAGLEPDSRLDYRQLSSLRVAGVRWVRRCESTKGIEGLIERDDCWLEVPDPLPRARLVTRAEKGTRFNLPERPGGCFAQIKPGPFFGFESTAITEYPLALPRSAPGTARIVSDRPGRMLIDVDCPAPQLLVVAERFHAGWEARVDGEPRPVLRANGDFMGCLVEPGDRRVELRFRPRSLRDGRILSYCGLALLAVCVLGRFASVRFPGRKRDQV